MKFLCVFTLLFFLAPFGNAQGTEDDIMKEIGQMHIPFGVTNDAIVELMSVAKHDEIAALNKALADNKLKELQANLDYIKHHPSSLVCLQFLRVKLRFFETPEFYDRFNDVFQNFTAEIRNSEDGKELAETLSFLKNSIVGKPATVFSVKDINGAPLSLANFKGKYVLLDFWASWCVPCRSGIPDLKALHQKYKDLGFEIISITKDENSKKWRKAVQDEQIGVWNNFSAVENDLSILTDYQVTGIPHFVLIDKNGIVAGKWKTRKDWSEIESLLEKEFGQK